MPIPVRPHLLLCQLEPPDRIGRRFLGLLALSLALLTAPALADPRMEGRFAGRGEGLLALQVLDLKGSGIAGAEGAYLVDADTHILDQCTGGLRGVAQEIAPRTLRLRQPADDGETCELTLRFSPDYARVTMSEERCFVFHGTACAFDGILRRR